MNAKKAAVGTGVVVGIIGVGFLILHLSGFFKDKKVTNVNEKPEANLVTEENPPEPDGNQKKELPPAADLQDINFLPSLEPPQPDQNNNNSPGNSEPSGDKGYEDPEIQKLLVNKKKALQEAKSTLDRLVKEENSPVENNAEKQSTDATKSTDSNTQTPPLQNPQNQNQKQTPQNQTPSNPTISPDLIKAPNPINLPSPSINSNPANPSVPSPSNSSNPPAPKPSPAPAVTPKPVPTWSPDASLIGRYFMPSFLNRLFKAIFTLQRANANNLGNAKKQFVDLINKSKYTLEDLLATKQVEKTIEKTRLGAYTGLQLALSFPSMAITEDMLKQLKTSLKPEYILVWHYFGVHLYPLLIRLKDFSSTPIQDYKNWDLGMRVFLRFMRNFDIKSAESISPQAFEALKTAISSSEFLDGLKQVYDGSEVQLLLRAANPHDFFTCLAASADHLDSIPLFSLIFFIMEEPKVRTFVTLMKSTVVNPDLKAGYKSLANFIKSIHQYGEAKDAKGRPKLSTVISAQTLAENELAKPKFKAAFAELKKINIEAEAKKVFGDKYDEQAAPFIAEFITLQETLITLPQAFSNVADTKSMQNNFKHLMGNGITSSLMIQVILRFERSA